VGPCDGEDALRPEGVRWHGEMRDHAAGRLDDRNGLAELVVSTPMTASTYAGELNVSTFDLVKFPGEDETRSVAEHPKPWRETLACQQRVWESRLAREGVVLDPELIRRERLEQER
jgi:hypothetical protein